LTRQNSLISA
jgi:hypothetical protein